MNEFDYFNEEFFEDEFRHPAPNCAFGEEELHEGRRERLRRRIYMQGIENLPPHEVLEFLLYYLIPRQDVNDIAHAMLDHFGDLKGFLAASREELSGFEELSEEALDLFAMIQNCMQECTRVMRIKPVLIKNFLQAYSHILELCCMYTPPCAFQLCMDSEGQLLFYGPFWHNSHWGEPAAFRNALQDVIASGARDIIVVLYTAQNAASVSFYDIEHTRSYSHLMHAARCELLDVVMVGSKRITSLRNLGLIPDYNFNEQKTCLREDYMRGMPPGDSLPIEDFMPREG